MPAHASTITAFDRYRPWMVRALWGLLPLTLGLAGQSAMSKSSALFRGIMIGLAVLVWGVGLLSLLVPHPIGLTLMRLATPSILVAAAVTSLSNTVPLWQRGVAIVGSLFVVISVLSAEHATWCIDGPAYPNESRYALSTPPRYFLISVLMCVLTSGALVIAAGFVGSERWMLGVGSAVVAAGLCFVGFKSVHQLSRRFVVFVPAGFVVHDPMALLDPVLFRKALVERIGLADAITDSLDLTLGSAGVPVEVHLEEKVELARLSDDRKTGEVGKTARFMVSPMRPGAVLKEAAARHYPVG